MKAKTWLQLAVCFLLLLNAGCDADYPLQAFVNTDKAESARHESNAVKDLGLWTMPLETDESGEVITERKFQHEVSSISEISDDTEKLNHLVRSEPQKRNKNHLVKQPTQEELRESLDRVNKVILRINKVLVSQQ